MCVACVAVGCSQSSSSAPPDYVTASQWWARFDPAVCDLYARCAPGVLGDAGTVEAGTARCVALLNGAQAALDSGGLLTACTAEHVDQCIAAMSMASCSTYVPDCMCFDLPSACEGC
jgi:hypothetical protein